MLDYRGVVTNQPSIADAVLVKRQKLQKASDPNTSPDILDELADFPDFSIQQAVSKHPALPLKALLRLVGNGHDCHNHPSILRMHLNPSGDEHPFLNSELHTDGDPALASRKLQNLLTFAGHPSASKDTLRVLAGHPQIKVVAAILKNKSVTPELLFALFNHKNGYVRTQVAKHALSSPILLSKMVDASEGMKQRPERGALACNHRCPEAALDKLANDAYAWVRRGVAKNRNCSVASLSKLAFDPNAFVRVSVLKHPKVPAYILARMAHDTEPSIRASLARSKSTPGRVLERLSYDNSEHIRACVASNPNTPSVVLDRLSGDRDAKVRSRVANHPNASEQAIERVRSFEYMPNQADVNGSVFDRKDMTSLLPIS